MSKEDHIEMSSNNFPESDDSGFDTLDEAKVLAAEETEDSTIAVWYETAPDGQKVIFLNIGNATINMSEQDLYRLTKLTQISAKKLLNID